MRIITPFAQLTRSRKMYSTSQSIKYIKPKGTARIPVVMNSTSRSSYRRNTRLLISELGNAKKWKDVDSLYDQIAAGLEAAGYTLYSKDARLKPLKRWFTWLHGGINSDKASKLANDLISSHDKHVESLSTQLSNFIYVRKVSLASLPSEYLTDFNKKRLELERANDLDGLVKLRAEVLAKKEEVKSTRKSHEEESQATLQRLDLASKFYKTFGADFDNRQSFGNIADLESFYRI